MSAYPISSEGRVPAASPQEIAKMEGFLEKGSSLLHRVDTILTAKAPLSLAQTVIRSMPYVMGISMFNTWSEAFARRIDYLETLLISLFSTFFNTAMGLGATLGAAVTFGQVDCINEAFKRFWTHAGLGALAAGVSTVGVVSPKFALAATALAGVTVDRLLPLSCEDLQEDWKVVVKGFYEKNREKIEEMLTQAIPDKVKRDKVIQQLDMLMRGESFSDFGELNNFFQLFTNTEKVEENVEDSELMD